MRVIPRKVVQITGHQSWLYALCDDGSVWQYLRDGWKKLDPIPPIHIKENDNASSMGT